MARPPKRLKVSSEDRACLERRVRGRNTPRKLVERSQVVLLLSEGLRIEEVAERVGLGKRTVYEWARRFERQGVAGLDDHPRSGRPRAISSAHAQRILDWTVHSIPREATHWSLRLMAKQAGVSIRQVQEVWKAADLKPHRLKSFKISTDPDFAAKVQDVVGLYLDPPDNALVLSVDEKTQIQALDRTQPMLPLRPGQIERRTHDYKRHGTRSLYAAFDLATGKVTGRVTRRHRAVEFLAFLRQIDAGTPPELDLHLILDNSSTHQTAEIRQWIEAHPRVHLHFTPTSASWLNAVETWFAQLERRAVHRGAFTSVTALRNEIHRYIQVHNDSLAKPFRWTKSAESIIARHHRLEAKINGTN
jgi:transposase